MKKLTLILFLGIFALKVFSNGGPIGGSAVYTTGDVVLVNAPSIQLIQEDLKIVIEGDYSIVDVTYELQNKTYSNYSLMLIKTV